jgi:hypothetical protein
MALVTSSVTSRLGEGAGMTMTAAEIAEKQRHIRHVLYWLNTLSAQLRILEKKKER